MERAGMSPGPRSGRLLWPRRNDLMRRVDWIEAALLVATVIVGLILLPVALVIGSETYAAQSSLVDEQARTRHEAVAVLLADAQKVTVSIGGEVASNSTVPVRAQWQAPDGETRVGLVTATAGTPTGTKVRIWLDPNGNPVDQPLTSADATASAVTLALVSWVSAVGLLVGLFCIAHAGLNRSRSLAWQREWAQVEPSWSHRA